MLTAQFNHDEEYKALRLGYSTLSQAPLDDTFWHQVSSLTSEAIFCARKALKLSVPELFSCPLGVAVVITGSDSRLEKCGLGSPVECIVITSEKVLTREQEAIVSKISKVCAEKEPLFYPVVDRKGLASDLVSTYEREGILPRTIPTRAFDAMFLGGDETVFLEYKRRVFDEVSRHQVDLKLFKEEFLTSALQNLRQELSGSPKKAPLLKVDTGIVFYEKARGRGIKHDVLRAVQYSLAFRIFKLISEGKLSFQEVQTIPATVMGRFEWFQQKKFSSLSDDEYVLFKKMYTQASYWYAQLNDRAVASVVEGQVITMTLDPRELRPVLQEVHDLSKKLMG